MNLGIQPMQNSIYFSEDHKILYDQIYRYISPHLASHGVGWRTDGVTRRSALRNLSAFDFLYLIY